MSSKKSTTKRTKQTKGTKAAKADPDMVPLSEMDKTKKVKKPKDKVSQLDAAVQVLKEAGTPLQCKQMVEVMIAKGLWKTDGKTPAATLYSAILREIGKKGDKSRFKKTDRGHFALNG
jgi:hypothetical protein